MKNNVKLLAIIALVAIIGFSMTGCNPDPEPAHVHQWEWTVSTPATCIATGEETGVCKLDPSHTATREIAINPDAHDWKDTWTTTPPTCTTTGIDTRTCSLNATHKETRNETTIDPNNHDWNTETGLCDNNCGELYYNIGDTGPGGGKIFYVSAEGFTMTDDNSSAHYLEAAPADMPSFLSSGLLWASSSYTTTGIAGTATAIGTGRKNTALILATDAGAPAAKACNDYSNGGKTDWFLPSKDELNELFVNRDYFDNLVGYFDISEYNNRWYWSSSEYDNENPWSQHFADDHNGGNWGWFFGKGNPYSARAVRAF